MRDEIVTTAFHVVGEIEIDSRRRIPLASLKLNVEPKARYRVEEGPRGELRLTPVFSVSADDLDLLRHTDDLRRITDNIHGEFDDFDPIAALESINETAKDDEA